LQKDLGLSATGTQWIINAYLLSLSALFAFGGRLADIAGHRRMVVIGVITFAGASALCGATPTGDVAEAWMIFFRVIQGAGAAMMIPAALAIIALILTARAKPSNERSPAPIDWVGTGLIASGMALAVLGLQQASQWGWGSVATIGCIVAGVLLLAAFVRYELGVKHPLIDVRIFRNRGFAAANGVLFLLTMVFISVFFFTSMYAQISLGEDASAAGLYLLVFFGGFGVASQWSGRIYDAKGVRAAVIPGCALAAVGFYLWAGSLDDFSLGDQWIYIVMAGAGVGFVLGPASTDALNRVASNRYGEATGINQTLRNFGASIGLAVLGTILINQNRSNIESSLGELGVPKARADHLHRRALLAAEGPRRGGRRAGRRRRRAGLAQADSNKRLRPRSRARVAAAARSSTAATGSSPSSCRAA
jgi:MFS family permease